MKLSGVIFLVVLLTLVLISSQARNLQASLQPQINSRTATSDPTEVRSCVGVGHPMVSESQASKVKDLVCLGLRFETKATATGEGPWGGGAVVGSAGKNMFIVAYRLGSLIMYRTWLN
uniref:Uncharacterized protein n=1 Tax=Helianthus annuus TaxID=4232 RepID=A0A251T7M9_HELAN